MILGAVRHGAGVLVPALNGAGEAVALAGAGDVNLVARGELVGLELVAHVVAGAVVKAELAQGAHGGHARLLEVTGLGLVQQLLGTVLRQRAEAHLNGLVAVGFHSLLLHHGAGARFNHGDRNETAVFSEDLRHADLFAHDRFLHVFVPPASSFYSLSSISTPAGSSSFIMASTVFGLGLLMSMRRLWVRRSNCSRLSLYL